MSEEINNIPVNQNTRLIKNAFFNLLSWFLPIIITIFGTPVIVKNLGYEQYGLYVLLLGFVNYSFTLGIGRLVTKYVAEYNSQNRNDKISDIISNTLWVSILIGLLGIFLIAIFAEFIVKDILQVSEIHHKSALWGLYIAGVSISFIMVGQVFQSALQGFHRFDKISILITVTGFLLTIGNIVLSTFGIKFEGLLVWNLTVSALNCLFYFITAKHYSPDFKLILGFKRETVGLILNYSTGLIGYQIFSNIILIFERSWVTRKFGSENLTYYVIPMMIAIYLHAFIGTFVNVIFPVFSELQNQSEKLLKLYRRSTKIVYTIIMFAATSIICAGDLFLTLWFNKEFANNSSRILIFHTLSFSIYGFLVIIWQLSEGFGHPRFNALISLIWLSASIPLMIILGNQYGIIGVAVSRFIGNFITLPFILIGEKQFLGKVQWDFWKQFIWKMSVTIFFTATMEIICFKYLPISWLTLFFGGFIGFAVYAAGLLLTKYFTDDELELVKNLLNLKGQKI